MKKYIHMLSKITLAIAIVSLTTIIFYACKKDTVEPEVTETCEMSENGKIVYNKLLNFQQNLRSTEKDALLMTVDSAQWYIEAYYNVTSGYPDLGYKNFDVDSASYILNIDENNMVSVSDMATLLSSMESHLNTIIGQLGTEPGHMVVADVQINQQSRSATEVEVIVSTGVGSSETPMYTPFPDDECWFYGKTAGRCDLTPSTPPYADAGDELEWRFNNTIYITYPQCASGGVKIIESTSISTMGYENPMIYNEWFPGDLEYPGYYGSFWNVYLNYGSTLFFASEQNDGLVPDGNCFFTSVDIFTDYKFWNKDGIDGYKYYHMYVTYYSVYECIELPD